MLNTANAQPNGWCVKSNWSVQGCRQFYFFHV